MSEMTSQMLLFILWDVDQNILLISSNSRHNSLSSPFKPELREFINMEKEDFYIDFDFELIRKSS